MVEVMLVCSCLCSCHPIYTLWQHFAPQQSQEHVYTQKPTDNTVHTLIWVIRDMLSCHQGA